MTYYDLGAYTRPITTKSPEAQVWFDRGLNWVFAFNHEEAIACFGKALGHDPGCAMAHWGIAYAAGPNYNLPWHLYDPAGKAKALAAAYDAMQVALACLDQATPVERALIRALPARYPQREPIEDQSAWDAAFTDAMRTLFKANRNDLEVRCVFVEAIMNETPWRMWDLSTGGVAEGAGTAEAVEVLEEALNGIAAAWDHPGLLHLYVHLMEMSPFPQRALRAGDRLRDLVPDAGHLIHMPTHIDVLCGHYRDVVVYNQKAIVADRKFLARQGPMNVYALYRTHNHHFAIYGAMFLGQYTPALKAAQELIDTTPEELLRIPSPPMADLFESFVAIKQHVLVRFGKWEEILEQPLPDDQQFYCNTVAVMHYAKGVAHAAHQEPRGSARRPRLHPLEKLPRRRAAEARLEAPAFHAAIRHIPRAQPEARRVERLVTAVVERDREAVAGRLESDHGERHVLDLDRHAHGADLEIVARGVHFQALAKARENALVGDFLALVRADVLDVHVHTVVSRRVRLRRARSVRLQAD
jgi:tetratricopeptide (TPR) repeat protein